MNKKPDLKFLAIAKKAKAESVNECVKIATALLARVSTTPFSQWSLETTNIFHTALGLLIGTKDVLDTIILKTEGEIKVFDEELAQSEKEIEEAHQRAENIRRMTR